MDIGSENFSLLHPKLSDLAITPGLWRYRRPAVAHARRTNSAKQWRFRYP